MSEPRRAWFSEDNADWQDKVRALFVRDLKDYQETLEAEPPDALSVLHPYALAYHRMCEAYDQQVCTGRDNRGIAIPVTPHEHVLVDLNARDVFKKLLAEIAVKKLIADNTAIVRLFRLAIREV